MAGGGLPVVCRNAAQDRAPRHHIPPRGFHTACTRLSSSRGNMAVFQVTQCIPRLQASSLCTAYAGWNRSSGQTPGQRGLAEAIRLLSTPRQMALEPRPGRFRLFAFRLCRFEDNPALSGCPRTGVDSLGGTASLSAMLEFVACENALYSAAISESDARKPAASLLREWL